MWTTTINSNNTNIIDSDYSKWSDIADELISILTEKEDNPSCDVNRITILESMFYKSKEPIVILNDEWDIVTLNVSASKLFWYEKYLFAKEELEKKSILFRISSISDSNNINMNELISSRRETTKFIIQKDTRETLPVEAVFSGLVIWDNKYHIWYLRDISNHEKEIQNVRLQWQIDPLTWLYIRNRYVTQ